MDPSIDLPTTTEPPSFNPAQLVVNHGPPTPTPPPTQPLPQPPPPTHPTPSFSTTHPDYAEMITAAITALKEKEGSSRIAISKYIDRVYSNLPPNHSALLTHHLKRLKNSGYLAMVKHSYMLAVPGSAPPPPPSTNAVDSNGSDVSAFTKRKPGRPPKLKPEAQQQPQAQFQDQFQAQLQAQLQAQQQHQAQFQVQPQFQTQPQFIQQPPQYGQQPQYQAHIQFQHDPLLQNQLQFQPQQNPQAYPAPEAQNYANIGAESVFVSLGLADGPVGVQNPGGSVPPGAGSVAAPAPEGSTPKKRPGRPRKDGSTVVKPTVKPKLPDPSGGTKRRPGRPPKSGGVNASPGSGSGAKPRGRPRKGSTPGRRGRPRKNPAVATNIPAGAPNMANVPTGGDPSGAILTPKRRGRPPRASQGGAAAVGVTDVPIAAAFDSEEFNNTVGGGTNGAMQPLGKRRGRPPKSYSSPAAVANTVKRQRKLSGKPLGRPRKNVTSPAVSDPKLVVAYEELKSKLEHMQSRIREAANALKPCLNAETPATALAAMQELEELAAPAGVNPMQQI
ncbi:uncharacterized protein LOC132633247 [Lycium barbarum]|uniref:uncharacterized protein LOC132633247 n=1 Tax=Lycium barbarum TaxID=112863 RepID=UPI00293E691B|nr:uncharacterized protein LOC132633247 [Lycium barbarum]